MMKPPRDAPPLDAATRAALDRVIPPRTPKRYGALRVGGVELSESLLKINPDLVAALDAQRPRAGAKGPRWRRPVEVSARADGGAILATFKGLYLLSELNEREHWTVKNARKLYQQDLVARALADFEPPPPPVRVAFVRVGPVRLDALENLPSSVKHLADAIARWAGVNDGDVDRWRATVAQERGGYSVRVSIAGGG